MALGSREINVAGQEAAGCRSGSYIYEAGDRKDECSAFHFWSLHSGGANFVFVDCSVHFLKYSVNSILPALSTRNGGEFIQEAFD
jgi:prepilin-type processing-associated H-X9-DG protein